MSYWDSYSEGANAGQQQANNVLLAPIQRQSALEQLTTQRQQNALSALNLQKQQMTYADQLANRQAASSVQGTPDQTTTNITPAPQTAQSSAASLGVNPVAGGQYLNNVPDMTPTDTQKLQANVAANPGFAQLTGSTDRLADMQNQDAVASDLTKATQPSAQVDASGFPQQGQTPASPTVQAYNEGRISTTTTPAQPATDAQRMKAVIDAAGARGDMATVDATKQQIMTQAKSIVDQTGNIGESLKFINDATGSNLSLFRMPDLEMLKNGDQIVGMIDKNKMAQMVMTGTPLSDAYKASMTPIQLPGGSNQMVSKFLADNPNMKAQDKINGLWKLVNEEGIPLKTVEPIITELQKASNEQSATERQIASQGFQFNQLTRSMASQNGIADKRMQAMMGMRMAPALDTRNGNAPTFATPEMIAASPGRYMPAGAGGKALGQTNLQEDIKGTIANTRNSLANLDADFTPAQAAQLNVAMRSANPQSAISAFYQSGIGSTLTPKQQEYIADLQQLNENAMAMRSVLGAGQGSDELRSAIQTTLPNATTPDRKTASMKLDKFEGTIDRLSRGIPKVQLNPMPEQGKVDTSRPVLNPQHPGVTAYRQADGSVVDATGKRLN